MEKKQFGVSSVLVSALVAALLTMGVIGGGKTSPGRQSTTADRSGAPTDPLVPRSPVTRTLPPNSDGAVIRPIGIMINADTRASGEGVADLAFLGTFSRTRVALELVYPSGGLFELDHSNSTLTLFRDDQGSDLISHERFFDKIEMLPRIAEDKRSVVFIVASDTMPAAGAASISLAGSAMVSVAHETERWTSPEVDLETGSSFQAGPYTFEVTSAAKSEWNDAFAITLSTQDDPSAILNYALLDGEQETELRESMSMSGMGSWQRTLELDEPRERGVFVIEGWVDARRIEIPFELETGFGLR